MPNTIKVTGPSSGSTTYLFDASGEISIINAPADTYTDLNIPGASDYVATGSLQAGETATFEFSGNIGYFDWDGPVGTILVNGTEYTANTVVGQPGGGGGVGGGSGGLLALALVGGIAYYLATR